MRGDDDQPLPVTWTVAQIAELAAINPGLNKSEFDDELEVSFVPMPAVAAESGHIDVSDTRKFGEVKKGYTAFAEGDVLFDKITPCMENGKMAVVPPLKGDLGFGSTEFHVLRPQAGIAAEYLYYYVSAQPFRREAEHNMTGAVGQRRVPMPYLARCEIPIAPTSEQRRIVAKIEALFSELDKGVETLTAAREQLKAYRQSVLKHAFEGKLTEDWRARNADKLEAPETIRKSALDARKLKWSSAVAFRRGKYVEPLPFDREDIPEIPTDWALVSMDELCHHITSGSRGWSQFYDRGDSVFIMAQNVRPGRYDTDSVQIIDPPSETAEAHRTRVEQSDVLVTIVGANTGDVCLFPFQSDKHYVCQSVALMRLANVDYAEYINRYFQAHQGGQRQYRRYIYGAGRPHLSFEQLRQTLVPLPSLAEQAEIVRILEEKLEAADVMEAEIEAALARAASLRQAILKRAFSGKLVPQDPHDEPAATLLARIRSEREAEPAKKRRQRVG
ncbi:hypothetical protein GC169_03820 [bacterium]|nr:hypothetical protein [bacterium]